ncbi:purine-nucleoside phosphorylase [Cryomorphaceae bacterium]|nr:purine-nucleoside phosphorylase [Cryomorphaceae bacterium]
MLEKVNKAVRYIQDLLPEVPEVGIILGTGLAGLAEKIENPINISYSDIPFFPKSTVQGHPGQMIYGQLGGKRVIAMQGRIHYYEGYSMEEVTFPVRVMKLLNIDLLLLSNASGGVNPDFEIGDIMLLNDHINLQPENPLRGVNIDEWGPRFPDMSEAYDRSYISKMHAIAAKENVALQEGVYASVPGPNFETPAEYGYIRRIGGDAVGMSTVPEVLVARHMGLKCMALSVITDLGVEGKIVEVTHEEVQEVAQKAEVILSRLVERFLSEAL